MDSIDGISLAQLAEYGARYAAFKAQHPEPTALTAFAAWLIERGTSSEQYWLAHRGWTARFRADQTGELEARFRQLEAEYVHSGEALETSQEARDQVGATQGVSDEPLDEPTPDTLLQDLSSASQATRWRAARLLAHAIDIGKARGGQFRAACVPVLLEILDRHDENTAADAEDAARRLVDIGERTSEVRASMSGCLSRAEGELPTLEAAFAAIRSSVIPERDVLSKRIDAYRSLVESLRGYLQDFHESPVASFAPPAALTTVKAAADSRRPAKGGGFGIVLPLLGLILVAGGATAFFLTRKAPPLASFNAASAANALTVPLAPPSTPSETPPAVAPSAVAVPPEASGAAAVKPLHAPRAPKHSAKPKHP